jgi:hypothetical protein
MTCWADVVGAIQLFGYEYLTSTKRSITYRPKDHSKIDHETLSLAVPVENVELWKILKHILLEREYNEWDLARYNAISKCQFFVKKTDGFLDYVDCSKGIDLSSFQSCDHCNQYSPVTGCSETDETIANKQFRKE